MEKIKKVWQDFETVQTSIEDIGVSEETKKYRTDFEHLYFEGVAACESLIIKDTEKSLYSDSTNNKHENGKLMTVRKKFSFKWDVKFYTDG